MIIFIVIAVQTILLNGILCDVLFQYDSEQCLDQPVVYQCTVTGSSIIRWRILDDEGVSVGTQLYDDGGGGVPGMIGGVFTVDQLQGSPSIITNISFTVQSSINGYTIICEDVISTVSENVIINIIGTPSPPVDIIFSVKIQSMNVSWTPPSFTSQCVTTVSSYSITSNAINSTINTTDTSVDIPLAGLSPGVYCVSVATVDTANRTGNYSDEECVTLGVPSCAYINCEYFNHSEESSFAICHWEFTPSPIPPLQWVYIYNNVTDGNDTVKVSGNLESEQITIMRDQYYMFSVFGENVIGNGTTCDSSEVIAYTKESFPMISPTSTSSVTLTKLSSVPPSLVLPTSSSSTNTTVTLPTENPIVIVISVAVVVPVTAVITASITVIILCVCQRRLRRIKKQSSNKATHPHEITNTGVVEMENNTVNEQVQYTTDDPSTAAMSDSGAYESMYM